MVEADEFLQLIPSECIKANALERITETLNKSIVVLFLKGTPDAPLDGYQKRAVELLKSAEITYTFFDVTSDSDVREILKEISRWNSFPQLFVKKKFIGGLHFIEEMIETNKVSSYIPTTEVKLPMRLKI